MFSDQEGNAITRGLPTGNDVPPPKNEVWEQKAKDSSVQTEVKEINYAAVSNTCNKKKGQWGKEEKESSYYEIRWNFLF